MIDRKLRYYHKHKDRLNAQRRAQFDVKQYVIDRSIRLSLLSQAQLKMGLFALRT